VTVNRWKDFLERTLWTAIQAAAAAALATGFDDWELTFKIAGAAAVAAALKVVVAQQFGSTPSGDAIPGSIYEP
jgi:hypothetical protein